MLHQRIAWHGARCCCCPLGICPLGISAPVLPPAAIASCPPQPLWPLPAACLRRYYIADMDNNVIRMVADGVITTVAGNGTKGFSGDGGQATAATLSGPWDVVVDTLGNLIIADTYNNRIR